VRPASDTGGFYGNLVDALVLMTSARHLMLLLLAINCAQVM